jgi:diphosphomevalonate decarboxylase
LTTRTAIAHPNIALVKYWGKRQLALNLPATGSISLTLAPFRTRTTVSWGAEVDEAWLQGEQVDGRIAERIFEHLGRIDKWRPPCTVVSESNFPVAAGLASSASAFAALTLAACAAAGQDRDPVDLSILARQGSGSASRSLFGGWAEWRKGSRDDGTDSYAVPLADADHWDLCMVVAIIESGPKAVGSTEGMKRTAETSPYYAAWVASSDADLDAAREAITSRNLEQLGTVMERSALKMHATMMTAQPPVRYWKSGSVWVMDTVEQLRKQGVGAWWTMDAGPNVKVLCQRDNANAVRDRLAEVARRVVVLRPGGPATLVEDEP